MARTRSVSDILLETGQATFPYKAVHVTPTAVLDKWLCTNCVTVITSCTAFYLALA